jgi:hypothetical protein
MSKKNKTYEIVRNQPVASFYYKGSHSRPVQRTVFITETDGNVFKGYEIREGNEVREVKDAPIKSFRKDWIATAGELRANSAVRSKMKADQCTLVRMSMKQFEEETV